MPNNTPYILAFLGALIVGCGEQKLSATYAEPSVNIVSHSDSDLVGEGLAVVFLAVVDDADDATETLVATWKAADRIVCEDIAVSEDGDTQCEMSLSLREAILAFMFGTLGEALGRMWFTSTWCPPMRLRPI